MPVSKSMKALLLAALFTTATLGGSASAAQVYFQNTTAITQPVDVYVDGTLLFAGVPADTLALSPQELSSGVHQVVVTPAGVAPGQQDLLRQTLTLTSNNAVTLTFGTEQASPDHSRLSLALTTGNLAARQ
ncbi:DUF4397 domain-containing protein [Deinococcus geothermalis]|uniref:DUF4397 domain-containing protein n=1 Tax=Deinococcus geothermalis (strain DSM 11300 / CIP 105573 / AG-3a) TaxID=319795 RepID=Q1J2L3_DEIGD|nr:DUF4397 domain-containing protein [Deinococcus geothermalis]ABF44271.1 hypothetical protein Dgeo_2842 [Deinococcus geothermalis DSM 11300]